MQIRTGRSNCVSRTAKQGFRYRRQRGWQSTVLPAQEREPVVKSHVDRFVSRREQRSEPGQKARMDDARERIEPLDEALVGRFPASDPARRRASATWPADQAVSRTGSGPRRSSSR